MLNVNENLLKQLSKFPLWIALLGCLTVIYEFGFDQAEIESFIIPHIYAAVFIAGVLSIIVRYIRFGGGTRINVWFFDFVYLCCNLLLLGEYFQFFHFPVFDAPQWTYALVYLVFIREFSALNLKYDRKFLNPAQLFIAGFMVIIIAGTFLLKLPNATHDGISWIDALFSSTSAVCITGLIVQDTGSFFTRFGHTILLILFQLGALGLLTFTSFFGSFFRGSSSYENQLVLGSITGSDQVNEVLGTLRRIILITFLIEIAGAFLIYWQLDPKVIPDTADQIFFSVFHSVSGFCNAGFSTLQDTLYHPDFRFDYSIHLIIAGLFIVGSLGFPIVFNFLQYFRHLIVNRLIPFSSHKHMVHRPWIINLNSRVILITTSFLLAVGTLLFFILEYNNTLAEHSLWGKIVTSLFSAANPRSSGFSTVDTSAMGIHALMLVMFLMWIGGSPVSTGGGLKTTTFAVMVLNIISVARGKSRIEVFMREIAAESVRRAYAIVALSIFGIGICVFLISAFDPHLPMKHIIFESFSAYCTVGLSMGITGELSDASKFVVVLAMLVGRVTLLTVLMAFFRKVKYLHYRYPSEKIMIN